MYELHARTHASQTPPGSRSRYQKYCRRSVAGSQQEADRGAEKGREAPGAAGRQRNRRCRGSGCLWQTPFLHAASSLSLPLSPSLSPFSPISLDSREMVIALSHVATLHCTAAASLPSPGLRPPFVDSFFARICAQAIDSDARFSSDAGMTSSRR